MRITRGAELREVMREGKRFRTTHLEVRMSASPPAQGPVSVPLRVGLIVPKFTKTAVGRNRVKRRLRELVRHNVLPSSVRGMMVIRIRPSAYDATFAALAGDVDVLLRQLGGAHHTVP